MFKNKAIWLFLGLLTVLALVLAGCASPATPAPTEAPQPVVTEAPAPAQTEAPAEPTAACTTELWTAIPGGALEKAYNGELTGKVVTMMGPFTEGVSCASSSRSRPSKRRPASLSSMSARRSSRRPSAMRVDAGRCPRHRRLSAAWPAGEPLHGRQIDRPDHLPAGRLAGTAIQPGLAGHG